MRGRVSAVNQVFIGSSNELGGMESGFTAKWFGLVPSVVFGGIGTIVVVILIALRWPKLRKFVGAARGELVHVQLAEEHRAGLLEAGDDGGIAAS